MGLNWICGVLNSYEVGIELDTEELAVCMAIADHADKITGEAFPRIDTLVKMSRLSARTIQRRLTALGERGLVEVIRQHAPNSGAQLQNRYRLSANFLKHDQREKANAPPRHTDAPPCQADAPPCQADAPPCQADGAIDKPVKEPVKEPTTAAPVHTPTTEAPGAAQGDGGGGEGGVLQETAFVDLLKSHGLRPGVARQVFRKIPADTIRRKVADFVEANKNGAKLGPGLLAKCLLDATEIEAPDEAAAFARITMYCDTCGGTEELTAAPTVITHCRVDGCPGRMFSRPVAKVG